MNILLVSQCSKQALVETRRVIDQFAERKGDRTWQTSITLEGLKALRRLLGKTAKRNTAVACHWIKKANTTELLWIVGNSGRFNEQGTVPTNTSERDLLRNKDENLWHTLEDVALLAGIAGLFHDFGKANELFQKKLKPGHRANLSEPFRHEWISLRLFQAFVGGNADQEWLGRLSKISQEDEAEMLSRIIVDTPPSFDNPFKDEGLAQRKLSTTIAWLILSHHRLPKFLGKKGSGGAPRIGNINKWMESSLNSSWNSPQSVERSWSEADIKAAWRFTNGTPMRSRVWQQKARRLGKRALARRGFAGKDWLADLFSAHTARMILMLADHNYSAQAATVSLQDADYLAYANTDKISKKPKQKLDEHTVGVSFTAVCMTRSLSVLRTSLPSITRHKGFKKRSEDDRFRWQDKAYELACSIRERASQNGFFGINMASTGCGKTFANARIMYGLANEKLGCRFSVATGLRTLTLQTGEAFRQRLKLEEEDLALMIGSQAVSQLYNLHNEPEEFNDSESSEEIAQYVHYHGAITNGSLSKWLLKSAKVNKLVSAPILVSTIDHLIPATEGERGGKQIAPMLRLLTSDLVLDEPDDFDISDLAALTRLVNWAGMLGSRVLISSATLPPSLTTALFDSYLAGRGAFQSVYGEPGRPANVCCAWFDENEVIHSDHADAIAFSEAHDKFANGRCNRLSEKKPLRKARILAIEATQTSVSETVDLIASRIHGALYELHNQHGQVEPNSGKRVSIGIVRMANINPLVAVSKQLFRYLPQQGFRIHYCVYHSRHPLCVRSRIEYHLDTLLKRHDPQALWGNPIILAALENWAEQNHIFVVLASPVAEVGRDHDYDWGIIEPSSMRSIVQMAGRIQRHRNGEPLSSNLLIMSANYKALRGQRPAYYQPGFESQDFALKSHRLEDLVKPDQLTSISAIPRIRKEKLLKPEESLVDLEHAHLEAALFGSEVSGIKECAAQWWRSNANWCYELQRRQPFRSSMPDREYVLYFEEEEDAATFHAIQEDGSLKLVDSSFPRIDLEVADGVSSWGIENFNKIILEVAEKEGLSLGAASRRFGALNIPDYGEDTVVPWQYHPILGLHRRLEN